MPHSCTVNPQMTSGHQSIIYSRTRGTIEIVWTNLSPRLSRDAFPANNVWVGPWIIPRNSKNWPGVSLATGHGYLHKMDCGDLSPLFSMFRKVMKLYALRRLSICPWDVIPYLSTKSIFGHGSFFFGILHGRNTGIWWRLDSANVPYVCREAKLSLLTSQVCCTKIESSTEAASMLSIA